MSKRLQPFTLKGTRNQNPEGISFWSLIREDLETHDKKIFEQGFWALFVHRLGNWRMSIRFKIFRAPMTILYRALSRFVEWTCGITIPYTTKVGRRVRLWHHGGMILVADSIGDDCHIRQNTTFGIVRRNCPGENPTISERVDIGAGTCILGRINIGHDSIIGANSVVLNNLPPYSLAVGAPAKVIKCLKPNSSSTHSSQSRN